MGTLLLWRPTPSPVVSIPSQSSNEPEDLVQQKRESFYITATGCEDGFARQGLQATGAGGL
jgi:hypothetical protein